MEGDAMTPDLARRAREIMEKLWAGDSPHYPAWFNEQWVKDDLAVIEAGLAAALQDQQAQQPIGMQFATTVVLSQRITQLEAQVLALTTAREEICLCAALRMADGYIFRGHRHDDCYLTMGGYAKYTKADGHQAVQGFLTSHGRFVTRTEAAELQGIKAPCMSEDLW